MARSQPPEPTQSSDLLAALGTNNGRRRNGVPCGFHLLLEALPANERARVDEIVDVIRQDRRAMRPSRFSASWLADVLSDHGRTIGRLAVQNHIAGRCKCGY